MRPDFQATVPTEELRLLVVSDAAPARNGVGAYYQDLCHMLATRIGRLELLCPQIVGEKWQAGFVMPMPGDPTQKICLPHYGDMKALIADMQPHVIVVATPGVYGLCAAHLATARRIPFLMGFHTSFEHLTELYWGGSWRGKVVESYFRICNRYLIRRAQMVLGNSASILEQAARLGADKTRLIGTPLAMDFLDPPVNSPSGRISRCLFAGRLALEKNIESILAAAVSLPDLNFSIAGDGPLRPQVEAAATQLPNLQYLGWQSRDELRRLLDNHDALLLPSHYETFGTIALEAMARGRLAIVSSGCGISQWPLLEDALVVIPAEQSLSECLQSLAQRPDSELCILARISRDRALALNEAVATEWLNLVQESLAPKGNN